MDFRTVKAVSIPEGAAVKIMSGETLLWKKTAYHYLIETATTDPGGTEIYNGTGYQDGYRWSSSGKAASAHTVGRLSGWIPFTYGATYRIKNFNGYTTGYCYGIYFILMFEDGSTVAVNGYNTGDEYNTDTDTFTMSPSYSTAKYFRISGYKGDNEPIITMNEEIPE